MPWIRDTSHRNINNRSGAHNFPAGRIEAAIADGERLAASRNPGRQRQLKAVLDEVGVAARDALNELVNAHRTGYELPETALLIDEHGKRLPRSGQEALREFLDEVRTPIGEGSYGPAREAIRPFSWEISERLVNVGWAPRQKAVDAPGESPAELAAQIPRG